MKKISNKNATFKINMRIGILNTIAKSIYSSPLLKIREAVANSRDNKATWFAAYFDRTTKTLSLFDNGTGITKKRFEEIFSSLGYGLLRGKGSFLSYFGLGLMSIFQLGKKVKVFSRPLGEEKILLLEVDSEKIFDVRNESKTLDFLHDCISLKESNLTERVSESPIEIEYIEKMGGEFPKSFTEIVIENVREEVVKLIDSDNFEFDLRMHLPLRPNKDEPFLTCIKDEKIKDWIINTLESEDYCKTIDVFWGIKAEKQLKRIYKYFPDFKQNLKFENTNIFFGESKNKEFAYYIVFTTEDLENIEKENSETGFWVRNMNFLVKPADFFRPPNSKKVIIHDPLKNWIFGEIFHKDMNDFLVVTRNDYVWGNDKFTDFYTEVEEIVSGLNSRLRKTWKYGKQIVDAIITPIRQIDQTSGPFAKAKSTLARVGIASDGENTSKIFQKLKNIRKLDLENEEGRIDKLILKNKNKIILADDDNSLVVIDPTVKKEDGFIKTVDPDGLRVSVSISPDLFAPKKVIFLDKSFELFFISGKENEPGFSMDVDNSKIFVNLFNHDIMKYSISFIDVYIAVELAYVMSSSKLEMKYYTLKLLGANYPDSSIYLTPLSDDLQRKKRI